MTIFSSRHRLAAAALVAFGALSGSVAAQEYPERDIQMIIPFGVGGGSDTLARTIASVIDEMDLLPVQILPENRPGGSGAVGYGSVAQEEGNPYVLATVSVSFFTTPLLGASPVSYEDFTPLAAISYSPYILAVPADSPYQTFEDLAGAERLTTSTVGVVSDAALLADMVSDALGIQIDAVPFDGEGEALAAILGGHVDMVFMNPSELMAQTEAGALRPLAVSSAERVAAFPDVPTFIEQGYDIEHVQLRAIVMPADVPQEALDYWVERFEALATSDLWREEYVNRHNLEARFVAGEELQALFDQTNATFEALMTEAGLI